MLSLLDIEASSSFSEKPPGIRPQFAFTWTGVQYTWNQLPYNHQPQTDPGCTREGDLLEILGVVIEFNQGKIELKKAQLVQKQVVFLGYEASGGQRSLGTARKEVICQTLKPQTVRDLWTFLGMTGWCRLWIYQYGLPAKPLYDLLKMTKGNIIWTPKASGAFKRLKRELMRAPALGSPDITKPFWSFLYEQQGMALGVLVQQPGPYQRMAHLPEGSSSSDHKYRRNQEIYNGTENYCISVPYSIYSAGTEGEPLVVTLSTLEISGYPG
ncbi:hypothetical protein BTVI_13395 [Pitangus sulphuratus]|nr:hypothetical protein BTVI_13395 [Pitangus sulphuratus]